MPPQGITTGHTAIDQLLYHRRWGKKELSVILGDAKSGKTTALINFTKTASLAGKNVLYVTCGVAAKIISERLDATMSDTELKNLMDKMHEVSGKIIALKSKEESMDKGTIAGLAFALSLAAGVVSILGLAATTAKLKPDLYNRPFKIYEDVLALYRWRTSSSNIWISEKSVGGPDLIARKNFRGNRPGFLMPTVAGIPRIMGRSLVTRWAAS